MDPGTTHVAETDTLPKASDQRNVGDVERWVSVAAGAGIIAYALTGRRRSGGYLLAALPLLYRGITGHCPLYSSLSLNTRVSGTDTRTALRDEGGERVLESVEIERPAADLYRFWRRFENLPRFMTNLERVTELSPRRSHWVAKGPAGKPVEWDAEVINEVENRVIGWRSLPGAEVVTAGSVTFRPARNGLSTQLSVNLQYEPPAGQLGAMVAAVFGSEPAQMIREDLHRLKQLFEEGELAKSVMNTSSKSATVHDISDRPGV
jgi:uncharacterized membrane protein